MFANKTYWRISSILTICLSSSICFAQHHEIHVRSATSQAGGSILPPGTIDGAIHPELIPDATAYRLFLSAACEQPTSQLDEKARQRALLARAQLSEDELATIGVILADYRQRITELEQAYNAAVAAAAATGSKSTNWALPDFPTKRDAIVNVTRAALAAQLSAPAMVRLEQLVQAEKRRMKIVPFPPMP